MCNCCLYYCHHLTHCHHYKFHHSPYLEFNECIRFGLHIQASLLCEQGNSVDVVMAQLHHIGVGSLVGSVSVLAVESCSFHTPTTVATDTENTSAVSLSSTPSSVTASGLTSLPSRSGGGGKFSTGSNSDLYLYSIQLIFATLFVNTLLYYVI